MEVDTTQASDDDLLRRSADGDETAFATLYRRRQGAIYRYALHMSGSASKAEEVTQEVFVALVSGHGRFDPSKGSVQSYLYGIARKRLLSMVQAERSHEPLDEETENTPVDGSINPLADLTRAEAIEAVRHAVLSLPAKYREPVVLCDLEEMSYGEAAETLGIPIGTVRSRISRGRTLLGEKLRSGWVADECKGPGSPGVLV